MKKRLLTLILVITTLIMASIGCVQPAPTTITKQLPTVTQAALIRLSYSNYFPAGNLNVILAAQWADEINRRTDGMVNITQYAGGSLSGATEIYDGVLNGISDIGMFSPSYTPGKFPVFELLDLPHGYRNGWVATKVANDFYEEFNPAEVSVMQVLYLHARGPSVIFTTKKPVHNIEDLKGLRLASTDLGVKIVMELGATGYVAAQGEAYDLMSQGVRDGNYAPLEVLKSWKQAEVVHYVTLSYGAGDTSAYLVVMNKTGFAALSPNIRKIFTDVSKEWIEKHGNVWSYYDKVAMDYFRALSGRQLISIAPDEMIKWSKALAPLKENSVRDLMAKGLPALDYEKYLNGRVGYWISRAPSDDECVTWVKANLESVAPSLKY